MESKWPVEQASEMLVVVVHTSVLSTSEAECWIYIGFKKSFNNDTFIYNKKDEKVSMSSNYPTILFYSYLLKMQVWIARKMKWQSSIHDMIF